MIFVSIDRITKLIVSRATAPQRYDIIEHRFSYIFSLHVAWFEKPVPTLSEIVPSSGRPWDQLTNRGRWTRRRREYCATLRNIVILRPAIEILIRLFVFSREVNIGYFLANTFTRNTVIHCVIQVIHNVDWYTWNVVHLFLILSPKWNIKKRSIYVRIYL